MVAALFGIQQGVVWEVLVMSGWNRQSIDLGGIAQELQLGSIL